MKRIMGVINLINEIDHLEELTYNRCVASVPFAGRYRLIDFVLSSMVNSGITNVAVFAHTKYRSLMDHLGSGKEWDLDRKRNGLFILPPTTDDMKHMYRGDMYHFGQHRDYFRRSNQDYVLITRSHMVCNIDFKQVLAAHEASGAHITLVYKKTEQPEAKTRKIILDAEGRVVDMQDHNGRVQSDNVSMEMYLLRKDLLMELIDTSLAQGNDRFVRDVVFKNLDKLRIMGYEYEGPLGVINTLQSYFVNSMKLNDPIIYRRLFYNPGLIYTKVKDEAPTKYACNADVHNSLIANGCIVEGKVDNSILFRGVRVGPGVQLKNCIVLQNSTIDMDSKISNAILDKDVKVGANKTLIGDINAPYIAGKNKNI
jgi:glucose-1-phosphate adenylyltransferase